MNEIVKIDKMDATKEITKEQVELIKKTVAKDANDQELAMFLYVAKQYSLDPFLKEICFIKRRVWNAYKNGYDEVPSIMTTRDGFLSIAHRSHFFDGMVSEATYDAKGNLYGATCRVHRKDMQHPFEVSVKFSEYCAYYKDKRSGERRPQALWGTKPETMIKKVAESQALRKAFDIHGLYANEELDKEVQDNGKAAIEKIEDKLEISKILYDNPDEYSAWVTKIKLDIITEIEKCENEEAVRAMARKRKGDIDACLEEDRKFLIDSIDSRVQFLVSGNPQEADSFIDLEKQAAGDNAFMKAEVPLIMDMKSIFQLKEWLAKNKSAVKGMLKENNEYLYAYYKQQWGKVKGNDAVRMEWVG